jgi:head-tail adaptor
MAARLRFAARVTILRSAMVDDGMSTVQASPEPVVALWADRRDVSDGEKLRSGELMAELSARFTFRAESRSRGITAKDRLQHGQNVFHIVGIKETRNGALIEVTCGRVDQ